MPLALYQVDAFTDTPFSGNPAAVCLLDRERDSLWMAQVAAEMNLAETAFLLPIDSGWSLRWFTPQVEVELCGHATLASAHILWEQKFLPPDQTARFQTRSGLLTAVRKQSQIELDFPAERANEAYAPVALLNGLHAAPKTVLRNRMDYLVELENEKTVRELQPDLSQLSRLDCRGVIVTAASTGEPYDIVSRFFAPGVGVPEDPVTGSAHCALAPYWQERLGRNCLRAFQASPRGGTLEAEVSGDRVLLRGQAVTILKGELLDRV